MASAAFVPDPSSVVDAADATTPSRSRFPASMVSVACPPGSRYPLLHGIRSRYVATPRLVQHIYESGPADGDPLVMLHGNMSSGRFFEDFMAQFPTFHVIAPDMRGYGATEASVVDASRGLRDFADDLHELVEALDLDRFHVLGWSMGGNVALQYAIDHSDRLRSLTLLAAGSPYGYGGTRDSDGQPNWHDFAGTGAGLVHPEVRARFLARDTSATSFFSPRFMLRQMYGTAHMRVERARENVLVEQMLMMAIGDQHYPGDATRSRNWPFIAPGHFGPNNALSPKYLDQRAFAAIPHRVPVLWIRGSNDKVTSDAALGDPGVLGKLHVIPRWPGAHVYPPQPMLAQLRATLNTYADNGGAYREEVIPRCGHAPHIERPVYVRSLVESFLRHDGDAEPTPTAGAPTAATSARQAGPPAIRLI